MRKELIERGMDTLAALEAVEKDVERISQDQHDDFNRMIGDLRNILKEAVWMNAVSEYRNRPTEMPGRDVAIMDIERLAARCVNFGKDALQSGGDGLKREGMQAELLKIAERIKQAP